MHENPELLSVIPEINYTGTKVVTSLPFPFEAWSSVEMVQVGAIPLLWIKNFNHFSGVLLFVLISAELDIFSCSSSGLLEFSFLLAQPLHIAAHSTFSKCVINADVAKMWHMGRHIFSTDVAQNIFEGHGPRNPHSTPHSIQIFQRRSSKITFVESWKCFSWNCTSRGDAWRYFGLLIVTAWKRMPGNAVRSLSVKQLLWLVSKKRKDNQQTNNLTRQKRIGDNLPTGRQSAR